jgi:beta-N-acetylhexosaminidase
VNLAPVLDVARRGSIMRRQQRSYGGSAARVTRIGGAFVRGLDRGGVAATGKHFPGLGEATKNQDLEVNRLTQSLAELRNRDERPFKALAEDLPLLMLSSAIYPALSGRPAVFSRKVVTKELRQHIGYGGVTISDALDAPAMARYGSLKRRARLAATAGVDLLLYAQKGPAPPTAGSRETARRILRMRRGL